MALFAFDQQKKVVISEHQTEESAINLPALASENHEKDCLRRQGEPEAECSVKSRKTKPVDWIYAVSLTFVLVFLCTTAVRLVFDSATRNYFIGRICHLVGEQRRAVHSYSAALSNMPDALILVDRADAYADMDDARHERDDLLQAIALMPSNIELYPRVASLEVRLGNIPNAIKIYKELATKERHVPSIYRPWSGKVQYKVEAAYGLILLDNLSAAKIIIDNLNDQSSNKLILKALLYREEGNRQAAMRELASPKKGLARVFSDSRDENQNGEASCRCLKALICLDNRELKEAQKFIDEAQVSLSDDTDPGLPIVDALKGWLLLEEGRLDECLKLTEKTLAGKSLEDDVNGLNLKAVLHLIREKVYLEQKLPLKATSEHDLYKQSNCSGRILTPTCFRMSLPTVERDY
jgi:tetratricopeptide (TPR) repeat protein